MKKYLVLIAAAITLGFTSCGEEDCNHDLNTEKPTTETKSVVGNWYEEAENEEVRFASNGTYYDKYCNPTHSRETEGRWEFDAANSKLTETYSFMGQTQFADWTVKNLTDYTLVISSNKVADHTYEKIVETYLLEVGGTQQITFAQTSGNSVISYTSNNPRLASVQSNGLVKAEGEKGTTYIKVETQQFNVWVKVVVGEDCLDLWYDYPGLVGNNLANVKKVLGTPSVNGSDGYSYGYGLSDFSDYLKEADVFLDKQTGKVAEIILALNDAMPESELLTYLKTHYYPASTIGDNYYTTCANVDSSVAVVYYNKENKCIHFVSSENYVFPDYTSDFGLKDVDIVKKYGSPYFDVTGYYALNNYYANLVAFNYNKTTEKVTAYSLIINDGVSAESVKALLEKKYKFYKESEGQYAYRDADTKEESKILVVYAPEKKLMNVYDLRNFE